jgi:hypothetical protein
MMKRFGAGTLILLIVILLPTSSVLSAGPGEGGRRVRLDNEPAGPYLLRVVTSPTPPRVENLYVEVRVLDKSNQQILTDVQVTILASPFDHQGETLLEAASHAIAPIPTEYAAHLVVPTAGTWQITVVVEGSLGKGEAGFLERVTNPPTLGVYIVVGAPIAGLALLSLVFLWMQRNVKRETFPR